MKRKRVIFRTPKLIYYTLTDKRTFYYKGTLHQRKIVKRVRINKDKFYKDIIRLK